MIYYDKSIYIIFIIILFLAILYLFFPNFFSNSEIEHYNRFLLWNIPTRSTRGMSYDIRGDPFIPRQYVGPWLNSPRVFIRNKPLWMVS